MGQEKKSLIKKIKAAGPMRALMGEYFRELDEASRDDGQKVAWQVPVAVATGKATVVLLNNDNLLFPLPPPPPVSDRARRFCAPPLADRACRRASRSKMSAMFLNGCLTPTSRS